MLADSGYDRPLKDPSPARKEREQFESLRLPLGEVWRGGLPKLDVLLDEISSPFVSLKVVNNLGNEWHVHPRLCIAVYVHLRRELRP